MKEIERQSINQSHKQRNKRKEKERERKEEKEYLVVVGVFFFGSLGAVYFNESLFSAELRNKY